MRLRLLTALAFVLVLALPSLAHASSTALIKDCLDGTINGNYSAKDYADALANLPADVDEYSDCRDQIRRAQLSAGGKGGSSSGGGGTAGGGGAGGGGTTGGGAAGNGDTGTGSGPVDPLATASPAEVASFQKAVQAGNAPVALDGRPVTPGTLGGAKTSGLSQLPTPLLVMLALLAAGGIGAAGFGTKRLVHGRRTA
jgi:hypothetical protein